MVVYSWENHLFLWAMASMAMLNNQMVEYMVFMAMAQNYGTNDPQK